MPYIQHQFNGAILCHYELSDQMTIGRHPDNDVVIDDATVSQHHAVIEQTAAGYQIRDLGSTNGLRVNGDKTAVSALNRDRHATIGKHTFCLVDDVPDSLQQTLKIKKTWIPGVFYLSK